MSRIALHIERAKLLKLLEDVIDHADVLKKGTIQDLNEFVNDKVKEIDRKLKHNENNKSI